MNTALDGRTDGAGLFHVEYGYDAASNRLFTRDLADPASSELYGYDGRHRLREFERGTLNAAGDVVIAPTPSVFLTQAQQWTDPDRRGNWLTWDFAAAGASTQQTRTVNGVNEVLTLDPDGSGTGFDPVALIYDAAGNLGRDETP